jgi:hypothetical protein
VPLLDFVLEFSLMHALSAAEFKNPHTVNERMSIRGHLSTIEFFYQLLQNSHGWKFDVEEYGWKLQ